MWALSLYKYLCVWRKIKEYMNSANIAMNHFLKWTIFNSSAEASEVGCNLALICALNCVSFCFWS